GTKFLRICDQFNWRRCAFVLSKRTKRGKVSRRSRSCWGYVGAAYRVGSHMATGWTAGPSGTKGDRQAPKLDCKPHGKGILKLLKHSANEYGYEHPLWTPGIP